jgi:hypothetical protein
MNIPRCISLAFTCAVLLLPARADNPPSGLNLQYATIVPHGDTISCYAVPIAGADGKITNYDIELHLTVAADGSVKADATKAVATAVPDDSRHFLPGDYVCVAGDNGGITVTGPVSSPSGRQLWSFITTGKNGTGHMSFADGGTWLSGPAAGDPMLQDWAKNIPLPPNVTFGRTLNDGLLGIQQLGDKLVIITYVGNDTGRGATRIFQRKPPAN